MVTVRDFTQFHIPPPLSFEFEKILRISPYPGAENLIHPLYSPTYSPGWPGVLPLGEADDMCIMADEGDEFEDFDIEKDLPKFLISVLDNAEAIFQGMLDQEIAEAHAEVADQSVKLIRSLKDLDGIQTRDIESLDSLATAFADVLTSLRHYIAMMPVTPTTVAENFVPSPRAKKESPGRPCFDIPAEMLEELRGLGFSWTKIGEMLGVSRWTIHRSV